MTTWIYEFEVVVDDEIKKEMGIVAEGYEFLNAISSFNFVKSADFMSGITKEKLEELKEMYED
jgi:hypothetical protein